MPGETKVRQWGVKSRWMTNDKHNCIQSLPSGGVPTLLPRPSIARLLGLGTIISALSFPLTQCGILTGSGEEKHETKLLLHSGQDVADKYVKHIWKLSSHNKQCSPRCTSKPSCVIALYMYLMAISRFCEPLTRFPMVSVKSASRL